MHQLLNIPSSAFFTLSSYISTRGHNLKLLKPLSRCRSRQLFLSVRSINDWNSLPAYIIWGAVCVKIEQYKIMQIFA